MTGSYTSALTRSVAFSLPPTARTFPFGSKIALCQLRGVIIDPVAVQLSDIGSYNRAETGNHASPAISTLPLRNTVTVSRKPVGTPLVVHVPVAGSYSSEIGMERMPPVTRTFPFGSNVAV